MVGLVTLAVLTALVACPGDHHQGRPGLPPDLRRVHPGGGADAKNPVTVAGIPVGTVTGMELIGDRVRVDMRVQDNVDVGKDSRAVIADATILGSRYLALHPGGGGHCPTSTIDLNHTGFPTTCSRHCRTSR